MSENFTEAHKIWEERILQWENSKRTLTRWAKENNFPYSQALYWKTKILGSKKSKDSTLFVELKDVPSEFSGIFIETKNIKIHLSKSFDEKTLQKCLNLIGSE